MDAHANFAFSTVAVAPAPQTTGLTLTVASGDHALFPAAPFNAVVAPVGISPRSSNAEIVRVTQVVGDQFTILRNQEGSTNRAIAVGDQIYNAPTGKTFTDIEAGTLPVGGMSDWAGRGDPPDSGSGVWLLADGRALSRATYAACFGAIAPPLGNPAISIANPGVFTLNGHGLRTFDKVYLTTTGALPTGLLVNTIYRVSYIDANTFNLLNVGGVAIATSGVQSGVHTIVLCPYGLGDGATTFNLPDCRGRTTVAPDLMENPNPTTGAEQAAAARVATGDNTLGGTAGEQLHYLTIGEMPAHGHGVTGITVSNETADHTHNTPGGQVTGGMSASDPHSHNTSDSGGSFVQSGVAGGASLSTASGTFLQKGAAATHTTSIAHTHTIPAVTTTGTSGTHTHTLTGPTDANGGGGGHNNMQPSLMVNKIIRVA